MTEWTTARGLQMQIVEPGTDIDGNLTEGHALLFWVDGEVAFVVDEVDAHESHVLGEEFCVISEALDEMDPEDPATVVADALNLNRAARAAEQLIEQHVGFYLNVEVSYVPDGYTYWLNPHEYAAPSLGGGVRAEDLNQILPKAEGATLLVNKETFNLKRLKEQLSTDP